MSMHLSYAFSCEQVGEGRRSANPRPNSTIGTYPAVSLKEARAKASAFLASAERGEHPLAQLEDGATTTRHSLAELAEAFLEGHVRNRLRSEKNAERIIREYVTRRLGSLRADKLERAVCDDRRRRCRQRQSDAHRMMAGRHRDLEGQPESAGPELEARVRARFASSAGFSNMVAIGTRVWLERTGGKLAWTDRLMMFADDERVRAAMADIKD